MLGFEKGSTLKFLSITICLLLTIGRIFYDMNSHVYENTNQFLGKFYIFTNLTFLSIGVLVQKKVMGANAKTSLFVICFYIYLAAFSCSILVYNIKWWNDTYNEDSAHNTRESFATYFSAEYLRTIWNILGIYIMHIMAEAFRYITLVYINKQGIISRVVLYGNLHGFYVIIIWKIFEKTTNFDYFFTFMVLVAYFLLFISKYTQGKAAKAKNPNAGKIRFKRVLDQFHEAKQVLSLSKVAIEGKYFYQSNLSQHTEKTVLFHSAKNTDYLQDTYLGKQSDDNSNLTRTHNPSFKPIKKLEVIPEADQSGSDFEDESGTSKKLVKLANMNQTAVPGEKRMYFKSTIQEENSFETED